MRAFAVVVLLAISLALGIQYLLGTSEDGSGADLLAEDRVGVHAVESTAQRRDEGTQLGFGLKVSTAVAAGVTEPDATSAGRLVFRVFDSRGLAPTEARAILRRLGPAGEHREGEERSSRIAVPRKKVGDLEAESDDGGRILFTGLSPGRYCLFVRSESGTAWWTGSLSATRSLDEGETEEVVSLFLEETRRFALSIHDRSGVPVPSCHFVIGSADFDFASDFSYDADAFREESFLSGVTDAEGRASFLVRRRPDVKTLADLGSFRVCIPFPGHEAVYQRFETDEEEVRLPVVIERPLTARLVLDGDADAGDVFRARISAGETGESQSYDPERILHMLDFLPFHLDLDLELCEGETTSVSNFRPGAIATVVLTARKSESGRFVSYPRMGRRTFEAVDDLGRFGVSVPAAPRPETGAPGNHSTVRSRTEARLRLVDENGYPLAASDWWRPRFIGPDDDWGLRPVRPGKEPGVVFIDMPSGAPGNLVMEYPGRVRSPCRVVGATPKTSLLRLVAIPLGQIRDLGELRFERPPIIVSGRVVDTQGRPQAKVTLTVDAPARAGYSALASRIESNTDGTFEVRADVPTGYRLHIQARDAQRAGRVVVVPAGRRDLELVVQATSTFSGWIDTPSSEIRRRLTFTLEGQGGLRPRVVRPRPSGLFRVSGLVPGEFTLRARLDFGPTLGECRFRLGPGEDNRPTVLQGWPVAGNWREAMIKVLDPEGEPASGASVHIGGEFRGDRLDQTVKTCTRGLARMVVARDAGMTVRVSPAATLHWGPKRRTGTVYLEGFRAPGVVALRHVSRTAFAFSGNWPGQAPKNRVLRLSRLQDGAWRSMSRKELSRGQDGVFFDIDLGETTDFRLELVSAPKFYGESPGPGLVLHEFSGALDRDRHINVPLDEALRERIRDFYREHPADD